MIGPDLLDRVLPKVAFRDWVFVICGPARMMSVVEDHLIDRGVWPDRILTERFDYD